jgi:general secretion pathway protein G
VTKAKSDIAAIENALKFYKLDNFMYPSTAQGIKALKSNPGNAKSWNGPYLDKLSKDPWGNDYQYRYPGTKGGKVDIYSFGADGSEGGAEEASDIGNWMVE